MSRVGRPRGSSSDMETANSWHPGGASTDAVSNSVLRFKLVTQGLRERRQANVRIKELERRIEESVNENKELMERLQEADEEVQELQRCLNRASGEEDESTDPTLSQVLAQETTSDDERMVTSEGSVLSRLPRKTRALTDGARQSMVNIEVLEERQERRKMQRVIDSLNEALNQRAEQERAHILTRQALKMQVKAAQAKNTAGQEEIVKLHREVATWQEDAMTKNALIMDLEAQNDELRMHVQSLLMDVKSLEEELEEERQDRVQRPRRMSTDPYKDPWEGDESRRLCRTLSEELRYGGGSSDSEPETTSREMKRESSSFRHRINSQYRDDLEQLADLHLKVGEQEEQLLRANKELEAFKSTAKGARDMSFRSQNGTGNHRVNKLAPPTLHDAGGDWEAQCTTMRELLDVARREVRQAAQTLEPRVVKVAA